MSRMHVELIRESDLLAEVQVTLTDDPSGNDGWGPTMSLQDAERIERVRRALQTGDLGKASRDARVYRVTPAA